MGFGQRPLEDTTTPITMPEPDDSLLNKAAVSSLERLPRAGSRPDAPLPANEAPVATANDHEAKKKLLLVNDNKIAIKILKVLTRKLGHECEVAENGKEGVAAYARCPSQFSAILMDIHMPLMGGLEATRRIRMLEGETGLPAVPIVMLTGMLLDDDKRHEEAIESGASRVMKSQLMMGTVREALESVGVSSRSG
jgi:CheY-like chemotaxis protein